MAKVESYKCDVCGKQKGDVNHWWITRVGAWKNKPCLSLVLWSDEALNAPVLHDTTEAHLCGSECAIKKVNEFLGAKP